MTGRAAPQLFPLLMPLMRAVPFSPHFLYDSKSHGATIQAMKKILAAALLIMVFASPAFAAKHHHHRHHHHHHQSA
jgi:predicted S18 family serine protease